MVGPTFNLEFNNFDNPYFPIKGLRQQVKAGYWLTRLGSRTNCLALNYGYEHIQPIGSSFLFRYSLDAGLAFGKLPLARYARTGGENFIGFASEEFTTPQKIVLHADLERKLFNLFGQDGYPFYVQLISNAGVVEIPDALTDPDLWIDRLHWGMGLGIRTNTPIGPLDLSLGAADFGRESGWDGVHFNFNLSVGREFRYQQ
jgi:outer membrane protein assembly factor BamA